MNAPLSEPFLTKEEQHARAKAARGRMEAAGRRKPSIPSVEAIRASGLVVALPAVQPVEARVARLVNNHEPGTEWKVHEVLLIVSAEAGVSTIDLKSERKSKKVCRARHVFFWLARRFTLRSYPFIGMTCGDRDHTTVMHGVRKIDAVVAGMASPERDEPDAWASALLSAGAA